MRVLKTAIGVCALVVLLLFPRANAQMIRGDPPPLDASTVAPRWRTILNLDFTALPDQTLTLDGAHTVGGVAFTKGNTATEVAPMAVVNGTGLVIQPVAATDISNTAFTAPWLSVPLIDIEPNLRWDMPVRVWARSTGLFNQSYKGCTFGIHRPEANTRYLAKHMYWTSGVGGVVGQIWAIIGGVNAASFLNQDNDDDLYLIELNTGIIAQNYWMGTALWGGSFPPETGVAPRATFRILTDGKLYDLNGHGALGDWDLLLSGQRAGAASTFSCVFTHVRVEVFR
jgi:hypothetical protein